MREESDERDRAGAANDNPGSGPAGAEARIDAAAMTLARLLGRRIARERFAATRAANDDAPAKDGPASPEG